MNGMSVHARVGLQLPRRKPLSATLNSSDWEVEVLNGKKIDAMMRSRFAEMSEVVLMPRSAIKLPNGISSTMESPMDDEAFESVRQKGFEQPLRVRALQPPEGKCSHEFIDSNGIEWIMAQLLYIHTIPVTVIEMSDSEFSHLQKMREDCTRLKAVFGIEATEPNRDLCYLAQHLEARETYFPFSIDQLDRIADGKMDDEEDVLTEEFAWLKDLRTCLGWWEDTATGLLDAHEPEHSQLLPRTDTEKERNEVCELLSDVYGAYVPALKSGYSFDRNWDDNGARLNLLKRYRLFTRCVCTLAQQVWPGVNMDSLLQQV
jgi:hypothetical protein